MSSITLLKIKNFRNLKNLCVETSDRFNVFFGNNAQGKTNILEAIYFLLLFRSFRTNQAQEMICFDKEKGIVKGNIQIEGLQIEIEIVVDKSGKKYFVDGKKQKNRGQLRQKIIAIFFSSEHLEIPRHGPSYRREFFDHAIADIWPAYLELYRDYAKVLLSRNKILREQPLKYESLLDVYDEQLSNLGAKIIAARIRYIRQFQPKFEKTYSRISQSGVVANIEYILPESLKGAGDQIESLAKTLFEILKVSRKEDLFRKSTNFGPHTHDIAFLLDKRSARQFGSQGQLRSLVLSFKLTQILDTYEKFGVYPILLLDDVSSELDMLRNMYLFDFLKEIPCQVFLTTTRPEIIPVTEKRIDFKVVRGHLEV